MRLLEALGDAEGIIRATEIRHEAFREYAAESGIGPAPAHPEAETSAGGSTRSAGARTGETGGGRYSVQDAVRGERGAVEFEEWPGRQAGDVTVLDTIARKESKLKVQALAEEIVDMEWPVAISRLSKLVGRGFGLRKVVSARQKRIERQIRNADLYVDQYDFVWPSQVDADEWTSYRIDTADRTRNFEEISPREIANALASVRTQSPSLDDDAQELEVLRMFGREKKTQGVRRQLDLAWELL